MENQEVAKNEVNVEQVNVSVVPEVQQVSDDFYASDTCAYCGYYSGYGNPWCGEC